jgi:hypothetical protein
MKAKYLNFVWAIVLIAAGVVALAQNFGYLPDISWSWWTLTFAGLSLLFFASYFASGVRNWGWLFPALIFAALAVLISLGAAGFEDPLIAAPLFTAIGLPFLVAYALDRRNNWWALIPAWVMLVLTLILALVERVPGEVIGALVMFAVGLPFVFVFAADRSRWWALIPAGTLCALGLMLVVMLQVNAEYVGALFVMLLAVPFGAVYLISPRNWWALIPAGVLASIGLMTLLIMSVDEVSESLAARLTGVMFLGMAVTFAVLWLRRTSQPTAWAIYPAAVLAVLGLLALALGTQFELVWPVALIASGVLMLYLTLRPRQIH